MAVNRADAHVIADRYELGEVLGRGGFGVVWRAHDRLLQRDVAIKEISFPPLLNDADRQDLRSKVLREARAAARLSHVGLVTVFDVVEVDDQPFIVMELVDAPTLAAVVECEGPLSEERAAAIGCKILDALAVAHAHGVIHRDIKPANVMLHSSGRVQLADFGIAILDDPKVTTSGQLAGSPSYMSPEQAQNLPASPATDLWGLGATLYYAVEGQPPFEKDGAIATLTSVVSDDPRPMRQARALAPLIGALLAKDPADRPAVEEVRGRLGEALARSATTAAPSPAPTAELPAAPVPTSAPVPPVPPVHPGPPSRPSSRPTARPPGPPRRRRPGAVVVVVAVAVVALAFAAMRSRDRGTTSSSGSTATTALPRPSPTTSATAAAAGRSAASANAKVPGDWVSYRDPGTGFTVSHPPGWTVQTNGTLTDIRDPASGAYLRIDHQQPPGPSAEGAWYALEPSFAADYPTYHRIGITPTTYKGFPAAIWEFTYADGGADLHAVDLGFIAGPYGFALNFQTKAGDWKAMQPTFEQFKSSFTAPA